MQNLHWLLCLVLFCFLSTCGWHACTLCVLCQSPGGHKALRGSWLWHSFAVLPSIVQYCPVLSSIVQYCPVLPSIVQYCSLAVLPRGSWLCRGRGCHAAAEKTKGQKGQVVRSGHMTNWPKTESAIFSSAKRFHH